MVVVAKWVIKCGEGCSGGGGVGGCGGGFLLWGCCLSDRWWL